MGAEWNGIVPVAGAGGGQIGPDGGLILAVCGDEPARQGKYSFQGFLRVHEHVACGRAHEYLDAADTAGVGPAQLSDIVIGGPYIKGVVGVGVPRCGGVFFFEGSEGGGRRVVVGHVHEGGGAAENCCRAFGGYAAFGGGSRLAEMHLVVDDAGKEEGSLIVPYDLTGQDAALADAAFADDPDVPDESASGHCCHFVSGLGVIFLNLRAMTPRNASPNMELLILDLPSLRSVKMMGTSFMRKPSFHALYFISIWNP